MFIGLSCSVFDRKSDEQKCPIDIRGLSLDDPSRIEGTWKIVGAATFNCRPFPAKTQTLRLKFTRDSVFVVEGIYDGRGIRSFKLSVRDGVLGGKFLFFDEKVVLLTGGDTLLVDETYKDGSQGIYLRNQD